MLCMTQKGMMLERLVSLNITHSHFVFLNQLIIEICFIVPLLLICKYYMFELSWVYFESELILVDSINNCVLRAQYVLWLEIHYRHRMFLRKLFLNESISKCKFLHLGSSFSLERKTEVHSFNIDFSLFFRSVKII